MEGSQKIVDNPQDALAFEHLRGIDVDQLAGMDHQKICLGRVSRAKPHRDGQAKAKPLESCHHVPTCLYIRKLPGNFPETTRKIPKFTRTIVTNLVRLCTSQLPDSELRAVRWIICCSAAIIGCFAPIGRDYWGIPWQKQQPI